MGPSMIQGQSYITEEKSRGFGSVFNQQMAVMSQSKVLAGSTYVHVDLHAGSGFNYEVGVIGSPVLFQQIAKRNYERYLMFAVEMDRCRASELGSRLRDDDRSFVFAGDNSELCECLPDILRQHRVEPSSAIGSVLVDPNGFCNQIPWERLGSLLAVCGRIDVVFNYPGTAYTRNRQHPEYVSIDNLPNRLKKKHWFVRKPLPTHKFTLCVGRNTDKLAIPAKLGLPFAAWNSSDGKRYRQKATMTDNEYNSLPRCGQLEFDFGQL